jgi:predicted tellurium resistance membrane protein TerC
MPYNLNDIFSVASLINLITLTAMEIVLGIDNVIFISIISGKLPAESQGKARVIGLSLALVFRICLLFAISFIVKMEDPIFTLSKFGLSGRDLILLAGGIFLIYKSSSEIVEKFYETEENHMESTAPNKMLTVPAAIVQIVFLDIVFSFDSILTAVGLSREVFIMIGAVIISLFIMLYFSKPISDYVNGHPSIRIMALAFLVMIGVLLVLEGLHFQDLIPKESIYVAMGFALTVELLNMRLREKEEKYSAEKHKHSKHAESKAE